jgi:hypothetical protein
MKRGTVLLLRYGAIASALAAALVSNLGLDRAHIYVGDPDLPGAVMPLRLRSRGAHLCGRCSQTNWGGAAALLAYW